MKEIVPILEDNSTNDDPFVIIHDYRRVRRNNRRKLLRRFRAKEMKNQQVEHKKAEESDTCSSNSPKNT